MIGPKIVDYRTKAQIARDENEAYEATDLRDAGRCVRCGGADPVFGMSKDHRQNRSQGGQTIPSNLQTLCGTGTTGCHGWKTSHPADATAGGYSVPGHATPSEWPGRRWVRDCAGRLVQMWVLYNDRGTYDEISDREAALRMEGAWPDGEN